MRSLRIAGLTANAVGAAGSFALTLYVGLRSGAPVLVPLFAVWVLSPFGALWLGHIASKRWLDLAVDPRSADHLQPLRAGPARAV